MKNTNNSHSHAFWTSYSDLMMGLFFLMLVLFAVTSAYLKKESDKYRTDAESLRKIKNLEASINKINPEYFEYQEKYKKHVLKVDVKFNMGESDMNNLSGDTQKQLKDAGKAIVALVNSTKGQDIRYLIVIEGQASNIGDEYSNYVLSYNRALALSYFWKNNGIRFDKTCEVVISGSGIYGEPRDSVEERNQRFLIHIIPKIGTLK